MPAHLARIQIFPIKSLDPVVVEQAAIARGGGLRHDRRFALVDADGFVIHGKRTPLVHKIRSRFDLDQNAVAFDISGQTARFQLDADRSALEAWLAAYFSLPLRLIENRVQGFPDDLESPGPTVVSTATLQTVAGWFTGLELDEVRRRFRANLEIDGVEPFWEDRLYCADDEGVRFQVGDVIFAGTHLCARCPVPARASLTGEIWSGFAKTFSDQRERDLPDWAERARFEHYYYRAVNTRLAERGSGVIRVGDAVEILPAQSAQDSNPRPA